MKIRYLFVSILAAASGLATAQNAASGVSKTEITLGTIQDLSGPVAGYGKQYRNGMLMRVDEVNEQGGVNGRKVRLLIEDSSLDPKKAVLAAQKLVNQDGIFAMLGHIGTAHNMAAMPIQMQKNVINFFPVTAGREMYDPPHRLKYALLASYYDQMRIAAPRLMKERNLKKACTLYQDDEYGLEVVRGAEAGLKVIGMELAEKTSYKRGATDFSSQVARMKAADCDMVVLGTIIRETVGAMAEARKTGFSPLFVGTNGLYSELIPKLGGKAVEGLFATMTAQHPYLDDASDPVRLWATKYRTKFNEDPTVLSVYGYATLDTFLKVADKVGPNLSTDSFIKTMDSMTFPRDMFGSPELTFSPTKRLASPFSRLSQIQDGRWKVVSDYVAFGGLKSVVRKDGKTEIQSEFFKD